MSDKRILVVDDDPLIRTTLSTHLKREQYIVTEAETAEKGLTMALEEPIDLALLDIHIPVMGGEAVLNHIKTGRPSLPVIVLTADTATDLAVRCMRNGAQDFLTKPFDHARLITTLRNVLHAHDMEQRLREMQSGTEEGGYDSLFGRSTSMRKIFEQLRVIEKSDIGVLIEGPSGTGKELVARSLHRRGQRADGPFVAINCGAIPETLLESELFGHERGAFTGAISAHPGCFEQAHKGTLFLDEIGEMRPDMQVRLLRSIENHEVRRLGSTKTHTFDVRLIAATNKDLKEQVARNSFREDLYFRLAVFRITLPMLRERENDIVGLAERFLVEASARMHRNFVGFDSTAIRLIKSYSWPGNVRELKNAVERATLIGKDTLIRPEDLFEDIHALRISGISPTGAALPPEPTLDDILPMEDEERRIFERALTITKGDVTEAAHRLAVGRATLYRRIKELGLKLPR